MAKESKGKGSSMVNQHKRMAMGDKVTGMKEGGLCMKKGGAVKKGKK